MGQLAGVSNAERDESEEIVVEDHDDEGMLKKLLKDLDPWTAWAYTPHTITVLILGACFLVWASGALRPEEQGRDHDVNTKAGVWAMVAVFLGYFSLQAPPTILIRPHPAFWRLVHGLAVLYLLFLTFLLFQTRDDARQFMKYLHPDLGVELGERSYGADCRIYTPENPHSKFANVYDTLFDEFVIAHILGWWGKSIMVRNLLLSWMISIGFEMMEVTLNHMLPNFNECWWDSIILDIMICNFFGIWAGLSTVRYFEGKTYEWVGLSQQPSLIGKVRRSLGQFTPAYWDKDQWNFLSGPIRFVQVMGLVIVILIVEVNAFYLKFILWIPPRNPLNSYRLLVWWIIANPAIREYNSFLQNNKPIKKLGAFCWLAVAIVILEVLICVKFGRGLFPKPMPTWIFWFWVTAGIVSLLTLIGWSIKLARDPKPVLIRNQSRDSKKIQ
ncbi:phosphatidylserine synthase 2 [Marchantia polymorpha subsp. ruderalis]|uniref:CDP-diacylglycerol--serine O-phosphatidyltransferase n=2 Tax=Marchantia polymorpha TaxID=3197 RepID=A0AAF6BWG5_MARPO|nr:hypothetical protein MARPO_0057s0110 [Marchantia polymorpha]BBN16349.1 hypothetical protein Mp_7g05610 [Marchantia polymorpha subsp. ruderalis]|eukprot:PTQ37509.1 hypothetical protein MARPO_0057s0110 [Marchantia polymorpha]